MLHGIYMGLGVGVGRGRECEAVDRAGKKWCEAAAGLTHVTRLRIIELKFLAPEQRSVDPSFICGSKPGGSASFKYDNCNLVFYIIEPIIHV